jgi:hypothetical protein
MLFCKGKGMYLRIEEVLSLGPQITNPQSVTLAEKPQISKVCGFAIWGTYLRTASFGLQ